MHSILLLEDDPNLGFILQESLVLRGYAVTLCVNGDEGSQAYTRCRYDLCLVDVMMPKKDGFTFAREIRKNDHATPIIFLTARAMKEDRIEGFTIGCDDYVTKPFSMEELILRIQAVIKRSQQPAPVYADHTGSEVYTIGKYEFDYPRQILTIRNKKKKLTGREADLLRLLCQHVNRTLDRNEALRSIWGNDSYFNSRSMDVFVSRLRALLKQDPSVEILTVHGKGVKLVVS